METKLNGVWNKHNFTPAFLTGIVVALLAFAVVSRVIPHPPNFAPIAAIAIFAGAILPKKWGIGLALGAIVVSDLIIGLHSLVLYTWGSFLAIAIVSNYILKGKIKGSNIIIASLLSSVFFFVITNFGVWAEGKLYPQTFEGLISAYTAAIPFFRNTLIGDLVYTGMLFGAYYVAMSYSLNLAKSKTT